MMPYDFFLKHRLDFSEKNQGYYRPQNDRGCYRSYQNDRNFRFALFFYLFIFKLFVFVFYVLYLIKGGVTDSHAMNINMKRGKKPAGRSKKGRSRRSKITYAQIGSKVMQDIRYLKAQFNVEYKYFDSNYVGVTNTTAGSINILNNLTLGTTGTTRNGQSIKITEISLHYSEALTTLSAAVVFARVILLYDQQPNAAVFASTDLLQNGTTDVLSDYVVAYENRFSVLYDDVHALNQQGTPNLVRNVVRYRPHHVEYNTGNAGTVADITLGSLWLFVFTDQAANPPTFSSRVRIRFLDN